VETKEIVRPAPIVRHWEASSGRWWMRPETLAVVEAGAATFDGVTTWRGARKGWEEGDPITRPLIGTRPEVGRMVAFGAVEVVGAYLLARRWPKMRWLQVGATGAHLAAGAHNATLGQYYCATATVEGKKYPLVCQ